eukprot:m.13163 g.13163  ORF g.13163 m.13163 type:complete len:74 (+) comp10108_c0_seq2:111-332(+)
MSDNDDLDRVVFDPESMGILVAALIAAFFLAGMFFFLFLGFRIYRCRRRYDKKHAKGREHLVPSIPASIEVIN